MYLDDVEIYNRDRQSPLEHVTAVLQSLKEVGLTANPTKCHLGKDETTYLWYTLGKGTVQPWISRFQTLQMCSSPSSKKQVHRFLGLARYYCHFIPGFSSIVAPLTDLLKSESPKRIQWTRACEDF